MALTTGTPPATADVVVVGAGFSGLYLLHRLRQLGFDTVLVEGADDVGGTWYWNRYPGARCDIPSTDYTFGFDPELEGEWTWSEKYATQPEILDYLAHVAEKYDVRRDICFETRVEAARWDEENHRWHIKTDRGDIDCQFYVMASGCLSVPKDPDIDGVDRYRGEVYFTGRWPHEKVDFSGQRVAVIGTGSSGIQSIPLIAAEAAQLTVFQRTPNFSIPAHNGPPATERMERLAQDRDAYRQEARLSRGGIPTEITMISGVDATEEVRRERFEAAWDLGELWGILGVFADQAFNQASNDIVAEMLRERIRGTVVDPEVAETLSPRGYPFGTKRPCLDTNYFETYNLPRVELVDLRSTPITTITETGIDTSDASFEFDAIVFATGFDAMTGPLVAVDIAGRKGVTLKEKWAGGPSTYLGLTAVGFPNFFTVTGPQSPSVLSNMAVSIEQHVEWISECLTYLRSHDFETIEPTPTAEAGWGQHCDDCVSITLYTQVDSWYMGANVPGKPRVFMPYIGGVDGYRAACDDVVAQGYLGFTLAGSGSSQCNDGVVRTMQPDVSIVLQTLADLNVPDVDLLSVADARGLMAAMATVRPAGPVVGEMIDGTLPGAAEPLDYRLYRPATPGSHPIVVYFHMGGWVLGDTVSDEPFCRDLCVRSDAIVVSVNYRHAPEHRFPSAADDAFAAVQWIAAHAEELGGSSDRIAVAGYSAGGNLAAVVCQKARDEGGPAITSQLLVSPVTDCDLTRPSYTENGKGMILTASVMAWFWDHYADDADRENPIASPLRGNLEGLPPAVVVTADFDPLRDEGVAYAEALAAAGVPVTQVRARGHIHTSLSMVDMVLSGKPVREEMAAAFGATLDRTSSVRTS
ncbi:MAG TPA: alpha/beta hydrolase fold domain-containing protein [Acidimicrobiales bacterium]|jgi:cation diffusion facilitator CzcD-associated flavoprotein CzcO/acetyl esterase/lipase